VDVTSLPTEQLPFVPGILGYLNFSHGKADPRFQKQLSDAFETLAKAGAPEPWQALAPLLRHHLGRLQAAGGAFQDITQAVAVLDLVFDGLLPAYRRHHADLLFHQTDRDLFQPFLLARAFEAVLTQGPPWEAGRIVPAALARLNDFVGHRPIAILETRPQGEPYDHERVRPVPLYLREAGVAWGPYQPLVKETFQILADTSPDLLADACFDLALLDELAFDPRAYDHGHPVNRRSNYIFGEWDPHHIDNQGRYRRFVVRQITLDALLTRPREPGGLPREELYFEAAAVLAGTMLMSAGVSGAGPEYYDSSTNLTTLMPRIARYRDQFYAQLLARIPAGHGTRLKQEAELTRQPFGAARQHLNHYLAGHRAALLQHRQVALLYADLGYPEAGRREAARIPTPSMRFLTEMHARLATGRRAAEQGELALAARLLPEVEELLKAGIACGALVDPWNILGFQGQFPLSAAREDSIRDGRVLDLIQLVDELLDLSARVQAEAAARGEKAIVESTAQGLARLVRWWDRFATVEVSDVPRVHGGEAAEAARHVAEALARWHEQGEATADLAFWRGRLERFRTPKAFAQVIEALIDKHDHRAAMALLINWVGQEAHVPLEEGEHSFHQLAVRWLLAVANPASTQGTASTAPASLPPERWALIQKFFDYLEVNAEALWSVPVLGEPGAVEQLGPPTPVEEDIYGAAYEGVTYQDTTDDDEEGSVIEGGPRQEFDLEAAGEGLLHRLKFLDTVARLWQIAAWRQAVSPAANQPAGAVASWLTTARTNRRALLTLMDHLHVHPVPEPSGSYDSLVAYDRHRLLKEQILTAAIATALDTTLAVRSLEGASGDAGELNAEDAPPAWHGPALQLEQALLHADPAQARAVLPAFVAAFRDEPLLFQPLADGGHPRQVLQAGIAQTILRALLASLPRLGLLRENHELLGTARAMEQTVPPGLANAARRVTVFDQLFQAAFQGIVNSVIDAASPDPGSDFGNLLDRVVEPFVTIWIEHCQSLRLSPLEAVGSDAEWERLRAFIEHYGADLFHARFMTLANLRGILHQGAGPFLDYLADNPDPLHPVRLLDELDRSISRRDAENYLTHVLAALVENYEEYKDYNTTTTQSDYGQNLYQLLDFLALKASYDRQAWHLRPLIQAHEMLVRRNQWEAARVWQEELTRLTADLADEHLADLADLEQTHGMRLRTIADHLAQRFVKPLALDRLCALIEPAMEEAGQREHPSFTCFDQEIGPYAAEPTGVGLDVPHWLRRLEGEVHRVRAAHTAVAVLAGDLPQVPKVVLTLEEVRRLLNEWQQPSNEPPG
jgi:hypothetical protein